MQRRHRGYRRFARDEGGALSLLMLLLIPAILLVGGIATDISQINAQKRYVQAQADLAAQSAARRLGDIPAAREVARAVVLANGRFGAVTLADEDIVFGVYDRETGFTPADDPANPSPVNAVEVTVPSPFRPILLRPFFQGEDRIIRREAVGAGDSMVAFTLRNTLLSVNTDASILNGVLNDVLGTSLDLDAIGYQGLADTQVAIDDLLNILTLHAAGEVVTFGDVLNLPIAVPNLLGGLVDLDVLPPGAIPPGMPMDEISPADFLALSPRFLHAHIGDVLPDVNLNVFDLLMATVLTSGPHHKIEVPVVGLDLGPLANVDLGVWLLDPGVTVIGTPDDDPPLTARVGQIRVELSASVLNLINLDLDLTIGGATAQLTELNCTASSPEDILAGFLVSTSTAELNLGLRLFEPLDVSALNDDRDEEDHASEDHIQILGQQPQPYGVPYDHFHPERVPVPIDNPLLVSSLQSTMIDLLGNIRDGIQADKAQAEAERAAVCQQNPLGCLIGGVLTGLLGLLTGLVNVLTGVLNEILNLLAGVLLPLDAIVNALLDALGIELAQAELILEDYSCGSRLVL